jgi:AAA domain
MWRDPAEIPPREALYGKHFMRCSIGATIGAGGRAKTTQGTYESISMAVGFDLTTRELLPKGPLRVWFINAEEDKNELDRRFAATCLRHNVSLEDLGGRLFVESVSENPMRLATLVGGTPTLNQAALGLMRDFITRNQIDVFMIDPFISFHTVNESTNADMDLLIKGGLGVIAKATNSHGEIFHHPGKPKPGQETTVEDGRGASAIIYAVRSARVFNFTTPAEATKLGIPEDQRRLHIRISNGKANMAPIGKAHWIKIGVENLPNGDEVACASLWTPPDPFDGVTSADVELARELARTGAHRADSRSSDWFGYPLASHLKIDVRPCRDNAPEDLARLKAIIKIWLKNNVLAIDEREDEHRKKRQFIVPGGFQQQRPEGEDSDDDSAL